MFGRVGAGVVSYKYRFFRLQRESALALGVFAFSDAPSPFVSFFGIPPWLFASLDPSLSQDRASLAECPPARGARERAWPAVPACHARHNLNGVEEAGARSASVVCKRYVGLVTRPQVDFAGNAPLAEPLPGIPDSRTT